MTSTTKSTKPTATVKAAKYTAVPINNVQQHPKNAREGNVDAIVESVGHHGFYGVIVVQRSTGHILAGNHRWLAAKAAGLKKIPVEYVDVDDTEARDILLNDNRTSDLATYDTALLLSELEDVLHTTGLEGTGYTELDLGILRGDDDEEDDTPPRDPKPSMPDEAQKRWNVKTGDVWQAGVHRLVCGDSLDEAVVDAVMDGAKADMIWTDPPYGVDYTGGVNDDRADDRIENDDLKPDDLLPFVRAAFDNALRATKAGGSIYAAAAPGPLQGIFIEAMGSSLRQVLVWMKEALVLGRSDYHYQHETLLYGWKTGAKHTWNSDRKQTSVLQFARPHHSPLHPTTKPVALVAYCIRNSSKRGDIVLDVFGGSGTTLIACEETGRAGRSVELAPRYVAVQLDRLSELGLMPEKVS